MRILVVGAGAIGGYFGGRLLEAGRDVTFLVRPERARRLKETGLSIRSRLGDVDLPAPTMTADALHAPFDLVLLSCKAYDLEGAMESFAPAVGADTAILPLLNGMRHLDLLEQQFDRGAVLGGQCLISVTLDADGRVLHLNDSHSVSFGERDGADFGAGAGNRGGSVGRAVRGAGKPRDRAGDVGEMGVHRDRRGDYLPDAGGGRRYRRGGGGGPGDRAAG